MPNGAPVRMAQQSGWNEQQFKQPNQDGYPFNMAVAARDYQNDEKDHGERHGYPPRDPKKLADACDTNILRHECAKCRQEQSRR